MNQNLIGDLARLHIDDLHREADANRLARSVDRADRRFRDRVHPTQAVLAGSASVVAAVLLLAVR
jgi:hypothetical protein